MGAGAAKCVINQTNLRITDFVPETEEKEISFDSCRTQPIVSLEQAAKPLVSIVKDIDKYIYKAKQMCKTPADGLTQDESAAIMLYTMGWISSDESLYCILNATLRSSDSKKLNPWLLYMKLFLTALSHLPSTGMRIVYRGVKLNLATQYPKGKKVVWHAFTSCTCTMDILESDTFLGNDGTRTIFNIECISGKDIRKHSFFHIEDEVLLLPGTHFQVISSLNHGHGLQAIQLKEIVQPPTKLPPIVHKNILPSIDQYYLKSVTPVGSCESTELTSATKYQNANLEDKINKCLTYDYIVITGQSLNDRDMDIIVGLAMNSKQCRELYLESNGITSVGATILAEGLHQNVTLQQLYLQNNYVSDVGAQSLAKMLSKDNRTLKGLNVASNSITDNGAEALADMLKSNKTLIYLVLADNDIGKKGIQVLADTLIHHNKSLEQLFLNGNKLVTDDSIEFLIQIFQKNQSLNLLWLRHCGISDAGKSRLREVVQSKKDFRFLV